STTAKHRVGDRGTVIASEIERNSELVAVCAYMLHHRQIAERLENRRLDPLDLDDQQRVAANPSAQVLDRFLCDKLTLEKNANSVGGLFDLRQNVRGQEDGLAGAAQ